MAFVFSASGFSEKNAFRGNFSFFHDFSAAFRWTMPKLDMALRAHKAVAMFMRYVHTEDGPARKAAELVANRRKTVVAGKQAREKTVFA